MPYFQLEKHDNIIFVKILNKDINRRRKMLEEVNWPNIAAKNKFIRTHIMPFEKKVISAIENKKIYTTSQDISFIGQIIIQYKRIQVQELGIDSKTKYLVSTSEKGKFLIEEINCCNRILQKIEYNSKVPEYRQIDTEFQLKNLVD